MTTLGITGSLNAPGLAVPASPVRPIPDAAGVLDRLLGSAAGATYALARMRETDRKVAFRDNMNRAVGAIMKGERRAQFDDPKVQDFYDSGLAWSTSQDIDVATIESRPGQTPGDAIRDWVEANSPGMSDRYKFELFRLTAP